MVSGFLLYYRVKEDSDGQRRKVWTRRWCFVKDTTLFYGKRPDRIDRRLDLDGAVADPDPLRTEKFQFRLTTQTKGSLYFRAHSLIDLQRWCTAVNQASGLAEQDEQAYQAAMRRRSSAVSGTSSRSGGSSGDEEEGTARAEHETEAQAILREARRAAAAAVALAEAEAAKRRATTAVTSGTASDADEEQWEDGDFQEEEDRAESSDDDGDDDHDASF